MIFSQGSAAGGGGQGEQAHGTAMAAIGAAEGAAASGVDERSLPAGVAPVVLWAAAARAIRDWLAARTLPARDAVVLLPFAALLPPLRGALALQGGWLPRVETVQTLAAAMAPPDTSAQGRCCGDPLVDALVVSQRLQREPWARDWAARDAAGFGLLASRVHDAVDVLRAGAAARPPGQRPDWWRLVRERTGAGNGRGAAGDGFQGGSPLVVEDRLLAIAGELALQAVPDPAERLFGWHPAAWIAVQLGGADPLAEALLSQGGIPALRLIADPPGDDPLAAVQAAAPPRRLVAADAEAEACAAADAVIEALEAGQAPVALVALDRMRTRRVRALLARQGVPLLDETGWRLSTSAAAVRVRALLPAAAALAGLLPARADGASAATGDATGDANGDANGDAAGDGVGTAVGTQVDPRVDMEHGLDAGEAGEGGADGWVGIGLDGSEADADGLDAAASPAGAAGDTVLEWLKAWPPARARPVALQSLEAAWRGRRRVRDRQAAAALWRQAQAWLRPWCAAPVRRPLRDWLDLLVSQLERDGTLAELAADAAGRQLLVALRLQPGVTGPAAWQRITAAMRFDLAGFTGWLELALDAATFDPPPDPGALVVLTPLARAIGRPFGAVVVPSSDQERLGAPAPRPALIDDRLAAALGLEHRAGERRRQRLALAQLLRLPSVTFVRRRQQADEAVAESPELAVLRLHSLAAGAGDLPELAAPVRLRSVGLQPVPRPLPRAPDHLPAVLSASAVGALRDCPYRFFSRSVLRLDEPAEFDAALAKRDYGDWLHLVLQHFHVGRAPGAPATDDAARLHRAAERATRELALDAAQLLPFRASFEAFVPAYLAWLAGREAAGWRFEQGEAAFELAAPQLGATRLAGRIDRIDRNDGGATGATGCEDGPGPGPVREVIDYKTGDAGKFRRLVANPLEDTQLAFYAALLGPEGRLQASYLALDGRGAPQRVVHERVRDSADALLTGLGGELARLRRGTPLPALGEGAVCETCEARGLCRRDHWASTQ